MKVCGNGHKMPDEAIYCGICGKPLSPEPALEKQPPHLEERRIDRRRYSSAAAFGIFLIVIGFVYFLQQYYKLPIDLWPVLLIFIIVIIAGYMLPSKSPSK